MIEGHKLIQAHFCNDERTSVEMYWQHDDDEKQHTTVRVEYCKVDESDEMYNWLLTQMSIDDLHEATFKHIKVQDEIYREQVIAIAKEDGLIFDDKADATSTAALLANVLFNYDEDKQKELLFQFKLQVFDMDVVKEASSATKSKIRKSETMVDVTKHVIELLV